MDAKRLLKQIDIAQEMLERVEKLLDASEPTAALEGDCEAEHNAYLAAVTVEEQAASAAMAANAVHAAASAARDAAYTAWLNCESP